MFTRRATLPYNENSTIARKRSQSSAHSLPADFGVTPSFSFLFGETDDIPSDFSESEDGDHDEPADNDEYVEGSAPAAGKRQRS